MSDVGAADPQLRQALVAGDVAAVRGRLLTARVLVPVVATGEESTAAEMAVPGLVGADGRVALPVFTGLDALGSWRPEARPVPMTGAAALVAALDEGYAAVVVDVAGPALHVVEAEELTALASAARRLLDDEAMTVHVLPE